MLVAVDAGGSSTRAVVLDPAGHCLGLGTAGSGNPLASGPDAVALELGDALRQAMVSAGVPPSSVANVVVAMAGAGSAQSAADPKHAGIAAGISAAGLEAPWVLESDLLAMFQAGSCALEGHALIAGTGAAAIRVRDGRVEVVADAAGWLLGDEGSGFWIGHQVVRAVIADLDGRGPSTVLTPLLLSRLGIGETGRSGRDFLVHLIEKLYAMRPVQLAQFAPLVSDADGDDVAVAILDEAARRLARTLATVVDDRIAGPLVLGGSVLLHQASIASYVEASFHRAGGVGPVVRVADGLAGAAVLALRHGGFSVDPAVFARVGESLAGLRGRSAAGH